MIENIKTSILWVLIISSIVLTYLIWTYQPDYSTLEQPEYFTSETIGEERNINDLLQPREIIIHEQEQSYWLQPVDGTYKKIIEGFQDIKLTNFYRISNAEAPSLETRLEGLEIIFPDRIQKKWIKKIFAMKEEDYFPMETLDRINLFINKSSTDTEVSIRFISIQEEEIYQVNTGLSENQLLSLYQEYQEQLVEVNPIILTNSNREFKEIKYVPIETMVLKEYTYYSDELSQESFKQALFGDPEFVKHYFQGNYEETFTDGSKMMNIVENSNVLKYIHPVVGNQVNSRETSILEASMDFINSHSGWTDQYMVDNWQETSINDRITFRMNVNGLRVLDANTNVAEYYTIELTRNNNRISKYTRPLFHLKEEVFELETDVELPSYESILRVIEESETMELDMIDDITIGYFMRRQNSFIIFEPTWLVKERGIWKKIETPPARSVDVIEREVEENGLE